MDCKSLFKKSSLFCYVCNVKAELMGLNVCKEYTFASKLGSYIVMKTNIPIIDDFLNKYSVNKNTFYLRYCKNGRIDIEKEDTIYYLVISDNLQNLKKNLKVTIDGEKIVRCDSNCKPNDIYYQPFHVELLYSVEINNDLKEIINDYSIEKSNLLNSEKKTKEEINKEIADNYFIKNFCAVNFEEKKDIKNCKVKITYKGNIKKFKDQNKGYILICEKYKVVNEELKKMQNNINDKKFTEKNDFEVKFMSFLDVFSNLTEEDKNKFNSYFDTICLKLKNEFAKKNGEIQKKIKEKQDYIFGEVKNYLNNLTTTPLNYSNIETEFNKFVSDDEKKYISLLKGDKLTEYNIEKNKITTKIAEIKNKITEYNLLKTNITSTLNGIITAVNSYSGNETEENFNNFILQKNNEINDESSKLESYKNYVANYNVFFTTLKNSYDIAVNNKKSEIELDKLKDTNVKNICTVINKSINDYIDSFDSITDIDDDKLKLQDINIENEIKNKISTNLDGEIVKIADPKIDKDEIKTKVNAFFTTDKINSSKSNICNKIINIKNVLKITFTLTVKNTLKLKEEFSNKLESIKNKYSNGVFNSVTFNILKSEISENRNDVKLFVNNSEVNYSEKITKGITINIEFPESYLIIDKPKDDPKDEHKDDEDPNKKEKKDQIEGNDSKVSSEIIEESDKEKGFCARCSGRNKTKSSKKCCGK